MCVSMQLQAVFPAILFWLTSFGLMAQTSPHSLDIQGHRGCRGLLPENTIPAFIRAVELGVTTLELDVVISQDQQVIVSHEPFLSHIICLNPAGDTISAEEEKEYNLYEMPYTKIAECDCGSRAHPQFPEQKNFPAYKPLLSDVIDTVEQFIAENGYNPILYNIETKSSEAGDGIFHPAPNEFVDLLVNIIQAKKIQNRTVVQSFDIRTLQVIKERNIDLDLALLVGNTHTPEQNLKNLGFTPEIYSPHHNLVNKDLMSLAKQRSMKVIPWTVNEREDIQRMLALGVDGIISDYPNRVVEITKKQK